MWGISFVEANYDLDVDLRDATNDRYVSAKEEADLATFGKTLVKWGMYDHAYKHAEMTKVVPVREAMDGAYAYISSSCDGQLALDDFMMVFEETSYGKELNQYLERRDILAPAWLEDDDAYEDACVAVAKCFGDEKTVAWYTYETRSLCDTFVEETYAYIHQRMERLHTMNHSNQNDEILANAKATDGPFDLLDDMERIGKLLFTKSDVAPEIHYFAVEPLWSFVDDDPLQTTAYITQPPHRDKDDPRRRFPCTNGVCPDSPAHVFDTSLEKTIERMYEEPTQRPQDFTLYTSISPLDGWPRDEERLWKIVWPQDELLASDTLQNNVCVPWDPSLIEEDSTLDLAQKEQEHIYDYTAKLDMDTRIALYLASKVDPVAEEVLGFDPAGTLELRGETKAWADAIFNEEEMSWENLPEMKEKIWACVEQYTNFNELDKDAQRKIIRSSISQPTALVSCVMEHLCREIGDPSARWIFRIQGCTIPSRRGYTVVSDAPVTAIEDVMNELVNVCTNLENSGQLFEHNKTKDLWDHKLMRMKFGDKIAFSLSIWFKPLFDKVDPAIEKRKQRENSRYLSDQVLGISDDLTQKQQRNKYVSQFNVYRQQSKQNIDTPAVREQKNAAFVDAIDTSYINTKRAQRSQQRQHAQMIDIFGEVIQWHIQYRQVISDMTHSLQWLWQAELDESKKKSQQG